MPNWSGKSAAPLHLILEPSRTLGRALVAVHGLAGFAALANPLPFWAKAGLLAAVGFSLYQTCRAHILDPAILGFTLYPDDTWEVIRRSGAMTATLADSTVVTRWIVILHLAAEDGILAIPICRDSADPEAFRRLRVHLRMARFRHENDDTTDPS